METIIGDLRQEIINGSTATVLSNGTTIYTPSSAGNMVPTQSPTPALASTPAILNLVRRSVRSDAISAPALEVGHPQSIRPTTLLLTDVQSLWRVGIRITPYQNPIDWMTNRILLRRVSPRQAIGRRTGCS